MKVIKVLAISGSLRHASLNTAVLSTLARLAPPEIEVQLYRGLGELPLFNPDLEENLPAVVVDLLNQILAVDVVVIASPEYAHGVTGAIKNALDWLVGQAVMVSKPTALLNASPRATHAQAALLETLLTMSVTMIEDACVTLPILGSGLNAETIQQDAAITQKLLAVLAALKAAVT